MQLGDELAAMVQSLGLKPDCLDGEPATPYPAVTLGSSPNFIRRWRLIIAPFPFGYWGLRTQ